MNRCVIIILCLPTKNTVDFLPPSSPLSFPCCPSPPSFSLLSSRSALAQQLPIPVDPQTCDSPHTKTHLLPQAHFSRASLPIADCTTDTKSVLDQALRILQVETSLESTTDTGVGWCGRLDSRSTLSNVLIYCSSICGIFV